MALVNVGLLLIWVLQTKQVVQRMQPIMQVVGIGSLIIREVTAYAGTTRTPTALDFFWTQPTQDWQPANDPCTIELGPGWRIPNLTEWNAVRNTNGYAG